MHAQKLIVRVTIKLHPSFTTMPIENVYDRFSFKFLIQATLENFGTHNRASTCSKVIGLEKYQTVRNQLQKKST